MRIGVPEHRALIIIYGKIMLMSKMEEDPCSNLSYQSNILSMQIRLI